MSEKWVRKTLTAELLSDAHFGSGSGGDGIDALIARDRYDRPVIWASHLEGVLRDAQRRLKGDEEAKAFFGKAGGQQQSAIFTSLYTEDSKNPERHVWRSTARASFDNRAPKDEALRVVEYVPKGTQFVGKVELPESQLEALERLVKEVDGLGSGRSSGSGRVKLSLSDRDPAPASNSGVTPSDREAAAPTGRLVLLLKNCDPLCITATATPDNLIPSLAFIPGRTLLGALAAWLIKEESRDVASLLTSGKVAVSDALPLPSAPPNLEDMNLEEMEVLPAPLSLQSEKPKGSADELPWWAQQSTPKKRLDALLASEASTSKEKLKRPEDDLFLFRANEAEAWEPFRPARRVRLRNGRPDPKQEDASLFAIEQIVEETHFFAELQGPVEELNRLAKKLGPVLEGRRWLRVGRAGAPVEVVRLAWVGERPEAKLEETMLLTLTSDLLVRDEFLRWRTSLDEKSLKELLGDDVQLVNQTQNQLQDETRIHGFNGTARLWRMPAAAIRRGSVFKISGSGIAKLAERVTQNNWLGERTHEGFGRFRLDAALPGVTNEIGKSNSPSPVPDVDEEAIAAETKSWFAKHESLASSGSGSERKPSLSQWNDLVGDIERGDAGALTRRLIPTTAGGRSWEHPIAKEILVKLEKVPEDERKLYARFFVRWLRAEMRKNKEEKR
ncbi:MAG: hypothetical protein LBM75_11305 [Myxococcales bacterium]|jgi:hypothetical protein|nr:hypothetical protein [Myxococcales bacterium]